MVKKYFKVSIFYQPVTISLRCTGLDISVGKTLQTACRRKYTSNTSAVTGLLKNNSHNTSEHVTRSVPLDGQMYEKKCKVSTGQTSAQIILKMLAIDSLQNFTSILISRFFFRDFFSTKKIILKIEIFDFWKMKNFHKDEKIFSLKK